MAYKDLLNQKLIIINYYLTTQQILKAREGRNWDYYGKLNDIEKMQIRLEELSIYEDIFENITDEKYYTIIKDINNGRIDF